MASTDPKEPAGARHTLGVKLNITPDAVQAVSRADFEKDISRLTAQFQEDADSLWRHYHENTADTEAPPSRSFRETLLQEGLRLATAAEERGRVYVQECRVCGEVYCLNCGMSIPAACRQCGTKWENATPHFWALLPKDVPPEEE